ncbi:MAG: ribonuclease III [Lentisphaeria bacterium]|nr:ribonuclease III [Lentisphaeria bacterium]
MSEELSVLQRAIGYEFHQPQLLLEAMTHKSYAAERNVKYDNQRLEFFGDAVVELVLTKHLYFRYPALQEGDLTKIRSALVNQDSLAQFARSIQLGAYLRFGQGEIDANGGERDSTVSDAFEALAGAIYLDGGYEAAEKFILEIFHRNIEDPLSLLATINPKGVLQEYSQAEFSRTPVYKTVRVTGPQHNPSFEVAVFLGEELLGQGTAQSRKNAEQAAAAAALDVLKKRKKEKEP